MPNLAPPARYDLPWKAAVVHAFHPFMDFYFPDFSARVDWRQRPRFRDKELAGSGIGATADVMAADLVVEVVLRGARQRKMLVHIEIQAQRDPALARRVHDYNYRIGKACGVPVVSFVLLADADPNWRPGRFRQRMEGRTFAFTTAKLLDYAADGGALEASHDPVAWLTLAHRRTQQTHHDPDKRYAAKLHLTRLLFKHRWKPRRIIVLFNAINWMMTLPEPLEQRFQRAILRLEKEHEMRLLNPLEQLVVNDHIKKVEARGLKQGRKEGRQEGRQEGLEQGRVEGGAAVLERVLMQRFGPLPQTVRLKLAKASAGQLEAWADALASAQSLKQVFK
ncbi:MAG TPA: transposase [Duganella sp.]|nr:transposase [Duganella sp.]